MTDSNNKLFMKFKENRESFGALSVDHELLEALNSYIISSDTEQLEKIYSSINIEDIYVIMQFLNRDNVHELSNKYDYTITELLTHIEHANKRIEDFKFSDKVLFGYVTVTENKGKYERRQGMLFESILSISHLAYKNWAICVFFNKPNNSLKEKLEKLSFSSQIYTITSEINKGLAFGRNQIIEYAKANNFDYIIFLDDDTYMIDKYLIEKLLNCDKLSSTFAFIGPEIVYKKSKVRKHGSKFFIESVINKLANERFEEVDYIEGSCHMIGVDKIGKGTLIGQYPEEYNCYWEETLPAFRAWHCANMQNILVKGARIVHIVDGDGFLSLSSIYLFVRNFIFFMKDINNFHPVPNSKKVFYIMKLFAHIIMQIPIYNLKYYPIITRGLLDGILNNRNFNIYKC